MGIVDLVLIHLRKESVHSIKVAQHGQWNTILLQNIILTKQQNRWKYKRFPQHFIEEKSNICHEKFPTMPKNTIPTPRRQQHVMSSPFSYILLLCVVMLCVRLTLCTSADELLMTSLNNNNDNGGSGGGGGSLEQNTVLHLELKM